MPSMRDRMEIWRQYEKLASTRTMSTARRRTPRKTHRAFVSRRVQCIGRCCLPRYHQQSGTCIRSCLQSGWICKRWDVNHDRLMREKIQKQRSLYTKHKRKPFGAGLRGASLTKTRRKFKCFCQYGKKRLAILCVIRYNKNKVDEFLTIIIFLTI